MQNNAKQILEELIVRYPELSVCKDDINAAAEILTAAFSSGCKLLVCGNGGSAADSMHIVGELMKSFVLPRTLDKSTQDRLRTVCPQMAEYCISNLQGALPAISLVSEIGLSTAYANDQAPDLSFAQQVLGHGKPGDILLAISTSGNSANVLYAAGVAHAMDMKVIGLAGKTGGKMNELCDICIKAPSEITFKIQEYHLPIYHALCLALETEFFD